MVTFDDLLKKVRRIEVITLINLAYTSILLAIIVSNTQQLDIIKVVTLVFIIYIMAILAILSRTLEVE